MEQGGADRLRVDFLACPAEPLLDDFVHRPDQVEPALVKAVSRHLARCPSCREEADRQRRGREESVVRRPWAWAALGLALLGVGAAGFLSRDLEGPAGPRASLDRVRPDPRLAALARFDPPSSALIASLSRGAAAPSGGTGALLFEPEDARELAVARNSIEAGRFSDGARLLEDLTLRHPNRPALRLLLAYALARSGEYERAHRQYLVAEALGAGDEACWGLVNTSLKLGDLATARHELAAHLLERRPDDAPLRDLLFRLDSYRHRGSS